METLEDCRKLLSLQATGDEIAAQFNLLSGGMRLPKDMSSENAAAAYYIALSKFSSWAIKQSIFDLLSGEAEDFHKTFMPAAPELAAYCRKLEDRLLLKINRIEVLLSAPEEDAPIVEISSERMDQLNKQINQISEQKEQAA